jgi:hypothetical protein
VHCNIYQIDAAGQLVGHEAVDLQKESSKYLRGLMGVLLPAPLAADGFVAGYRPWRQLDDGLVANYRLGLARALADYWPSLLLAHLLAAALAIGAYRRQVRYGAAGRARLAWSLFVFFFGLPGWIGYIYLRSWPVLARCPDCAAVVPQDRTDCARCHVDFPLPALKGTEVFAGTAAGYSDDQLV